MFTESIESSHNFTRVYIKFINRRSFEHFLRDENYKTSLLFILLENKFDAKFRLKHTFPFCTDFISEVFLTRSRVGQNITYN